MKEYALEDHNFAKLSKTEPKPKVRLRLIMMEHLKQGRTVKETAQSLLVSDITVRRWYTRYQSEGLCGLHDKPKSGCPFKLAVSEHENFKACLITLQEERKGGRVTGEDIRQLLSDEFGVNYALSGVYDLLHNGLDQQPFQAPPTDARGS